MRNKHIISEVVITDLNFPNKGIGYIDGKKTTVKNVLPGQKLEVRVSKKRGEYTGRVLNVIEKSPIEVEPACADFGNCGGCTYQHITYEDELKIKEEMVLKLLKKEGIESFEYLGIEASPSCYGYRNKMEFSFGDEEKGGSLALGMRKRDSYYEVVTSKNCNIVDEDYVKILQSVLKFFQKSKEYFYHKATHEGSLRHLVVRKGFFTGDLLINLSTTTSLKTDLEPLVEQLKRLTLTGQIVGILHTKNDSLADVVQSDETVTLYGKDYFFEKLLGLNFKITAFSFFQTNSAGAEKLYATVKEFIGDGKDKTIFDLYCGTGTIAQIISRGAKEVVGVELVEEAVQAAVENTKLNGISNCKFIAGDVLKVIDELEEKPDIIVLDPPREGIHPKAILKVIGFGADKIVYVSCKPTSLSRDLKVFLENGYVVEKVRCHDMFGRTVHVETVVLLTNVTAEKP